MATRGLLGAFRKRARAAVMLILPSKPSPSSPEQPSELRISHRRFRLPSLIADSTTRRA